MMDAHAIATIAGPILARETNVRAAFLFGSLARGKATPDSDVDLAIVGAGADVLALAAALSAALAREVDVVELTLESPIPLLRAVLRDGKRIYERAPGLAATFASHARSVLDLDGPGYDLMMRAFLARVARRGVGA